MDDDIDLGRYLRILWRRRNVIAAAVIVAAIIAGLYGSFLPPTYEAKAMISKPAIQVGGVPSGNNSAQIGALFVPEWPAETLVAFVKSSAVVQALTQYLGGAGRSKGLRLAFSATAVRNTNLVELKARGRDPMLAARAANAWAEVVAAQSTELLLTDIAVALRQSEVELSQTEAQLRGQPKILILSKSITTDSFLHQAASRVTQRNFVELSKLQLKTEELNPLYIQLDQTRANLAVRVASLRAEQGRLSTELTQLTRSLEQLAAQQLVQSEVPRAVKNARQVHGGLLQRREGTHQSGSARLVAAATVPEFPVAPRKSLNILVGVAVGLLAGAGLAFVMEYLTTNTHGSIARPAPVASAEVPSVAEH